MKKKLSPDAVEGSAGQQDVPNSNAQSPVEQIAEASTSDAAIEGEHAQTDQKEESAAPEQSTQANGKDYNWKQMREQVRQLNAQIKALEGAANLEKWLKAKPENFQMVMNMMSGKGAEAPKPSQVQSSEQQEDPYKDFDPVVAERFRKLDALEKWKAELERQQEQQKSEQQKEAEEKIQQNMADLDASFDEVLIKDGFLGEDGSGDQNLIEMIQDAVLARLARQFGDPTRATRAQMLTAYKTVTEGLSAHQKFTLKKTVKKDVPLSGSTRGSVPSGKTTMTEQDRLNTLVGSL